jgi:hypothetical protein
VARFNEIAHEIDSKTREAREKGNRLSELQALEALQGQYAADPAAQEVLHNLFAYALVPIGDYAGAMLHSDLSDGPPRDSKPAPSLEGYAPVDALQLITGAAETAQIIMINEAHIVPQNRAFVIQLLHALRAKGFTYLASEMIHDDDMRLVERGYMPYGFGATLLLPDGDFVVRVEDAEGKLIEERNVHK